MPAAPWVAEATGGLFSLLARRKKADRAARRRGGAPSTKAPEWVAQAVAALRKAQQRESGRRCDRKRVGNLERIAITKAWRQKNPGRCKALAKNWRSKNLQRARQIVAQAAIRRRARTMNAATDGYTLANWLTQLEVFGHRCAYCLKHDDALTQDHVTPLTAGGAHSISNVVPACKSCNSRKWARGPLAMLNR